MTANTVCFVDRALKTSHIIIIIDIYILTNVPYIRDLFILVQEKVRLLSASIIHDYLMNVCIRTFEWPA